MILDPAPLSENFPNDPCKKRGAEKEHLLEMNREREREREKGGTRAGRFKAVETYRARNSRRKRLKAGVFKKKREKGRGKKEKTKRLKRKKKEDGGVDSKKGKSKQKVRFRKEEIFIRKKLKMRNV